MNEDTIEIKSLDDIFYYYSKVKDGEIEDNVLSISVDDFLENFEYILDYKDNLDRLHGTIDITLASAIIDLQEFINNLYKTIKYQDTPHALSDEELSALRIYVKIADGSTKEIIKNTRKLLEKMVENMTGTEKVIVVAIVSMALTAGYVGTEYINHLNKKVETEQAIQSDTQETERTKAIIKGFTDVNREIQLRPLYKEAIKNGQKAVLKPVKQNNSYTLQPSDNLDDENTTIKTSYIIDEEKAKRILKTKRSTSETDIINDSFFVKYIEALEDNNKYKVKLISTSSDISGIVEFNTDDEDIDFSILSSHLANRTAVSLTIKTKTIKGNTTIEKLIATITDNE
jgi:succinate dehydrogenase flavin-adding protein (antitoxin of CptAB toxin-antitoxin module)